MPALPEQILRDGIHRADGGQLADLHSEASPEQILRDGIHQLGLGKLVQPGNDDLLSRSMAYINLLGKWNRVTNLTAITQPGDMATRLLLDSLTIADHLHGKLVLDAGSGAGLPGIPLAMVFPDIQFILLDSNTKKTRFMTQAKIELALDNVTVVHCRLEDFDRKVDQVMCRALASLGEIVTAVEHLLEPGGQILAMKGAVAEDLTLEQLDRFNRQDLPLHVPLLDAKRHLVVLTMKEGLG